MIRQSRAARNRSGIAAEKKIDEIFLRHDLALHLGNSRGGTRAVGDRLVHFELIGNAAEEPSLVELNCVIIDLHGPPAYFQFQIKFAQNKIRLSDVGN